MAAANSRSPSPATRFDLPGASPWAAVQLQHRPDPFKTMAFRNGTRRASPEPRGAGEQKVRCLCDTACHYCGSI